MLIAVLGCNSQQKANNSSSSPNTSLTATVVSYQSSVEWDHFQDGSFETHDQLQLKLDPDDASLSVSLSPKVLPPDSPLRIAGTRFSFHLDSPISSNTKLFWGAVKDPTVLE